MSRSVVTNPTPRCGCCQHLTRWCVCGGFQAVECRLRVDILTHPRESRRPTSTGHLVKRVMPLARAHAFTHDAPLSREGIVDPERVLWILHPAGAPSPSGVPPSAIQVLLLDGSWREAGRMRKIVGSWGRCVSLPATTSPSRYHLRDQHAAGNYSTAETLILLLDSLGEHEAATRLRAQFELHVYAGLRARGAVDEAAAFLAGSSLARELAGPLQALQERRRHG